MATPLFLVLVLVETTDLVFAVDSIPAIFAVTQDPFLVYTSNVFAILGLRSLYFLLAGVIDKFHYLKLGLSVVLVFVGAKMLLVDVYKVPIGAVPRRDRPRARGLRRGVLALPQGGRSARPGGARSAAGAAGAAGRGGGAVDAADAGGGAVDAGAGGRRARYTRTVACRKRRHRR